MTEIYEYSLVRVVPRVERGEAINVGVIVYSQAYRYLCTRIAQAHERLAPRVTAAVLEQVTRDVPEEWLGERGADAYVSQLLDRAPLVPEVIRQ